MDSLIGLQTTYTGTARNVLLGVPLAVTGFLVQRGAMSQCTTPLFERPNDCNALVLEDVTMLAKLAAEDVLEVGVALGSRGQASCRRWYVPARELHLPLHLFHQKDHDHDHDQQNAA